MRRTYQPRRHPDPRRVYLASPRIRPRQSRLALTQHLPTQRPHQAPDREEHRAKACWTGHHLPVVAIAQCLERLAEAYCQMTYYASLKTTTPGVLLCKGRCLLVFQFIFQSRFFFLHLGITDSGASRPPHLSSLRSAQLRPTVVCRGPTHTWVKSVSARYNILSDPIAAPRAQLRA